MTTPEAYHAGRAADEIVDHLRDVFEPGGLQLCTDVDRTLRSTCARIIEEAIQTVVEQREFEADWPDD